LSINLVVIDGVAEHVALRYDDQGKPELRLTLVQTTTGPEEQAWTSYWPCCAVGAAAERLASEIEDGQHLIVTSGKLTYKKRTVKGVEQSRMEILVWSVDRLSTPLPPAHEASPEYGGGVDEGALPTQAPRAPRRRPYPKAALDGGFQH